MFCIPLTGSDNLERNFNLSKIMGSTGLSLQKIIKNLSRIWLTMLNQKIKSFTLNVSIRICQTINLKIVATQAVSHQVRISSVLVDLMLNMYGKLFWTKRVVTGVATLFYLVISTHSSYNLYLSPLRILLLDELG